MAPGVFPVARLNIASSGVAAESMISEILPATKRSTTRKRDPVIVPIPTQAIIICGPVSDGFGISVRCQNSENELTPISNERESPSII
jgi:hypothetical protein